MPGDRRAERADVVERIEILHRNLMPNSSSTAKISWMWVIESQAGMSSAVISGESSMLSSAKVVRKSPSAGVDSLMCPVPSPSYPPSARRRGAPGERPGRRPKRVAPPGPYPAAAMPSRG